MNIFRLIKDMYIDLKLSFLSFFFSPFFSSYFRQVLGIQPSLALNLRSICLSLPSAETTGLAQIMPLIRRAGYCVAGCVWRTCHSLRDHDLVLKGGQVFLGNSGSAAFFVVPTKAEGAGVVLEFGKFRPQQEEHGLQESRQRVQSWMLQATDLAN